MCFTKSFCKFTIPFELFVNTKENRMNWGLKLFKILARPVCIGKEGEFEWYAVDFAHWIDGSNVQWVSNYNRL